MVGCGGVWSAWWGSFRWKGVVGDEAQLAARERVEVARAVMGVFSKVEVGKRIEGWEQVGGVGQRVRSATAVVISGLMMSTANTGADAMLGAGIDQEK